MRENARLEFDRKPGLEDNSSPDVLLHEVSGSVEGKANIIDDLLPQSVVLICAFVITVLSISISILSSVIVGFLRKVVHNTSNWQCMKLAMLSVKNSGITDVDVTRCGN